MSFTVETLGVSTPLQSRSGTFETGDSGGGSDRLVAFDGHPVAYAASETAEPCPSGDGGRRDHRGTGRQELQDGLLDGDTRDVSDHWKISVVQSPFCRRTSCARAGPSGRSDRSTKNLRSTSIPPFGSQSTRSSHERSSG